MASGPPIHPIPPHPTAHLLPCSDGLDGLDENVSRVMAALAVGRPGVAMVVHIDDRQHELWEPQRSRGCGHLVIGSYCVAAAQLQLLDREHTYSQRCPKLGQRAHPESTPSKLYIKRV